jgi:hypothetical protein
MAKYYRGLACVAFYGEIDYRDANKNSHITRFCMYWFQQNGRLLFSPVGPPDWVKHT